MKLITFQYGPTGQLNKDDSSTQMDYLDCTYDFWNCTFLIIKPLLNLIFKIKLSISRIIRSFIYEFLNLFGVLFYHWMVIRFHGVVKLCWQKIHLANFHPLYNAFESAVSLNLPVETCDGIGVGNVVWWACGEEAALGELLHTGMSWSIVLLTNWKCVDAITKINR